jgi:opacity protein-like surface antigen
MKRNNSGKVIKVFMAISVLSLGLQAAAYAGGGIGGKGLSIGPRATHYTPKDAEEGQWAPGAQARLQLSSALGLEASIDYLKNDFGPLTAVKTYPVQASLLAYIIPGGVVSPFLLGGVGWYYTQVDGPASFSDTTSRFGLHAGAGLEVMLNKSLSLDGSYRYVWLESIGSKDANAVDKTYEYSGPMITLALNLLF